MSFTTILLLLSVLPPLSPVHRVSDNLHKKLNAKEEQAICCHNRLPCCHKRQSDRPVTFEVKAIVTECPNLQCTNTTSNQKVVVNSKNPPLKKLTNCHQKLLLTIKMTNEGVPNDKSEYVIIDHIVDAVSTKKVRILNPYAVRIRQQPVQQLYGLHFDHAVNSEAQERVYNKQNPGFRGCSLDPDKPSCRVVRHGDRVVPYSSGFCCSCDEEEPPDRHRSASLRPRRGGQNCDDMDLTSIPQSFHQSAHCLTFSDLWYSVYSLKKPILYHQLRIQIFQKYEDCHGNTHWMDLTQGKVVEIGTHRKELIDKTLIARYLPEKMDESCYILDYKSIRLLVPEKRISNPEQFMVLPKSMVSSDGSNCDTAGVGYEAFYKQKKRCAQPQGSCLKNQPQHLFQDDLKAEQEGKHGNYFLKFYGTLGPEPVRYNLSGQLQYVKMIHTARHTSDLYFEMNADLVTVLKPNNFATITEVYTDATNPQKTKIIVKVTNSGLLYGIFYVRLGNCPMQIAASFNNIASKSVLILPQHQHIFNLYIEYSLPMDEFYCSIHVLNINQDLLAVRAVKVQTYDRCICIWHCSCVCYVADRGLRCTPLSLDAYHQAGFQGGFPFSTRQVESSYLDLLLVLLLHTFTYLIITLLIMGLIKAVLGLVIKEIGEWGLDQILGTDLDPGILCDNEDCEWRRPDGDGISRVAQFCLNLVFFIVYPLVLINMALMKLCFGRYTVEGHKCNRRRKTSLFKECEDSECVDECEADCNLKSTTNTFSMRYTTTDDKSSKTTDRGRTFVAPKDSLASIRSDDSSVASRRSRIVRLMDGYGE